MTVLSAPFFEITPNYDLLIKLTGVDYNAQNPGFVLPVDQYADLAGQYEGDVEGRLRDPEPLHLTEPLVLSGFFDTLPHFDYLPARLTLPIVSRRLLDVLNEVEPLNVETLPVRIVDNADPDVLFNERAFGNDAQAIGHQYSDDYVMLRLMQRLGVSVLWEEGVTSQRLTELALPPMFRQQGEVGIFVTAAAREAMVAASIKGCDFDVPIHFRRPIN